MFTHLFKSINWVDVALAILFVRVVYISVTIGLVTELFKLLGVITAIFVSLHYYAYLAAVLAEKTTLPITSWRFLFFVAICVLIVLTFKFLRDSVLILFKVETTHQGFDKYGAGVLGVVRAFFLCSLTLFGCLLIKHSYLNRQAFSSYSYKLTAKLAPNTYKYFYDHLVVKLFEGEKFNADVFAVVGRHGADPK